MEQPIERPLKLADNDPIPGDFVIAVGYPEGGPALAGRGRVVDYIDGSALGEPTQVIRSSVETEPGSSGKPLLDEQHRVVGLIFAIERRTGLTLAIPVSKLRSPLSDPSQLEAVTVDC